MKAERWREVDALFHEAVSVPAEARERLLVERCGEDVELLEEVNALLASDDQAGEGFVREKVERASLLVRKLEHAPRRAGPYVLERVLGRGGMGTVYLGRRADGEYDATVAVKVVRPGMDTDFFLSRFRRERQTLGRLTHPNIARLLDSGTTDEGLPYIVMEYIDGIAVNAYCRARQLGVEEILRLFIQICSAVSYAHQQLVVHRDIKPGNILVDSLGCAHLLDFGICKLLLNDYSEDRTMTGMGAAMTPDYASPEQVRGEQITAASDVYSLGAVLFELLTGSRPHLIEKFTPQAIEKAVCEEPVRRASTVTPERLKQHELKGDLDVIIERAMQKRPADRYVSVAQMSDDIERHLADLPILARPDSTWMRLRRLVRRNTGAVLAASAVVLALAIGGAVATYQALEARRQFAEARQLANAMVFEVHDKIRDLPGSLDARQTIVKLGMGYLDRMAGNAQYDAGLRRELASAYLRMGEIQGNVVGANTGDTKAAAASLEKAIRLLDSLPLNGETLLEQLQARRRLADLQAYTRSTEAAQKTVAAALALLASAKYGPEYQDRVNQHESALLSVRGRAFRMAEDNTAAIDAYRRAVVLIREYSNRNTADLEARGSLGSDLSGMAASETALGRRDDALQHLQEAVTIWDHLSAIQKDNAFVQRQRMLAYSHLGDLLGDGLQAQSAYKVMLESARDLRRANPQDLGSQTDVGMALLHAAALSSWPKGVRQAMLLESREALLGVAAKSPQNYSIRSNLAIVEEKIGDGARASEARKYWREGMNTALEVFGSGLMAPSRTVVSCAAKLGEREIPLRRWLTSWTPPSRSNAQSALAARAYAVAGERDRAMELWRAVEKEPAVHKDDRAWMQSYAKARVK